MTRHDTKRRPAIDFEKRCAVSGRRMADGGAEFLVAATISFISLFYQRLVPESAVLFPAGRIRWNMNLLSGILAP